MGSLDIPDLNCLRKGRVDDFHFLGEVGDIIGDNRDFCFPQIGEMKHLCSFQDQEFDCQCIPEDQDMSRRIFDLLVSHIDPDCVIA